MDVTLSGCGGVIMCDAMVGLDKQDMQRCLYGIIKFLSTCII